MSLREFGGSLPVGVVTRGNVVVLPKQPALARLSSLTFNWALDTTSPLAWGCVVEWKDGGNRIYAQSAWQNTFTNEGSDGRTCFGLGLTDKGFKEDTSLGFNELHTVPLPWQVIVPGDSRVQVRFFGGAISGGSASVTIEAIEYRFRTFD